MRQKLVVAAAAKTAGGEQIKLLIPALPEVSTLKEQELVINPYLVTQNYQTQILQTHNALQRAGYPAHILHEHLLPTGALTPYRTLVIVGQTHPLPTKVQAAVLRFIKDGGRVVVDKTTTVAFPGAITADLDVKDTGYQINLLSTLAVQQPQSFTSPRAASYYQTNAYLDAQIIRHVAPLLAAMARTKSVRYLTTGTADLQCVRHIGGEGAVYMVLNGHQELPTIADDATYDIWNWAPMTANYTLGGLQKGAVVYAVEGVDWMKVSELPTPTKPITGVFAPTEMKLYLVAPRRPKGLSVTAQRVDGMLEVTARLTNLRMPWPVRVTVKGPDGQALYDIARALDATGTLRERLPLGTNAKPGAYTVAVTSPVGALSAQSVVTIPAATPEVRVATAPVRIFDEAAMRSFLAGKPAVTIAIGSEAHRPLADRLAAALGKRGVPARVVDERTVVTKARYPRIWDLYCWLFTPTPTTRPAPGEVKARVTLEFAEDGQPRAVTEDGKDLGDDWRTPGTLVTIGTRGYVNYIHRTVEECYAPGCVLYVDAKNGLQVLNGQQQEVQTTPEYRAKWAMPWSRLLRYEGGYQIWPRLPDAYTTDTHLILLGDSTTSQAVAALQASEILPQVVDAQYPGPGKALLLFAWSPFALEKNVIYIGASDTVGLEKGIDALERL
jgi:hypothetical protein